MPDRVLNFANLPRSAITAKALTICLKCAFDFFLEELHLSSSETYAELQSHTPEAADFSGAATSRPHFHSTAHQTNCPYCHASKRWFAVFRAYQIYAHSAFEPFRASVWAKLERQGIRFALSSSTLSRQEIFFAWLEELKHRVGKQNPDWWQDTVTATISFFHPSREWDEISQSLIRRITVKGALASDWFYADGVLQLSPTLYGKALLVDHLIARALPNENRRRERRLSLPEFLKRLEDTGFFKSSSSASNDDQTNFEQAVAALVAYSPLAVYYAVDRRDYLQRLNSIYKSYTE
ncbi:MAG: hypothetical protein HY231_11065 [Acidobacteria bacterium]|nr:hypothetical protein [Acidobacteriota bacterium]